MKTTLILVLIVATNAQAKVTHQDDDSSVLVERVDLIDREDKVRQPELRGVAYDLSTASNGGIVWRDRGYTFSNLPSYLVGTTLFQVPHKAIPQGTVIEILIYKPSTIYIAHESRKEGGFMNSLRKVGWTLVTRQGNVGTGCCHLNWIWKMDVTTNGLTTITLPATTNKLMHSIFVAAKPAVPTNCEWDNWVTGECSKTCATGTRTNTRAKLVEEADGGTCTGQSTETEQCNIHECPVNCKWGEWEIGDCSVECGGGLQPRFREKTQEALYGGACEGEETDLVECNPDPCPVSTACPEEKSSYCSGYVYYYPQLCKDTPRNQWFLGEDGRYACRKSCGLC